jgi:putative phosphoribosyl transferase
VTADGGERGVSIPAGDVRLEGDFALPPGRPALGLVVFAHGSGSSRRSPRNQFVARTLRERGLATLLFDLLTRDEEIAEARTRHLRFDIDLLAGRLVAAVEWVAGRPPRGLGIGIFGASTGAAAALVAAAQRPVLVRAVVSRGGRPDLAGPSLAAVRAPTLLVVGSLDEEVITLNRGAAALLRAPHRVEIVNGASHLFEEPGTLEEVARLAGDFFVEHLASRATDGDDHAHR